VTYAIIELTSWLEEKRMLDILNTARELVDASWKAKFFNLRVEEGISKASYILLAPSHFLLSLS
jgi:hypothetical protein